MFFRSDPTEIPDELLDGISGGGPKNPPTGDGNGIGG